METNDDYYLDDEDPEVVYTRTWYGRGQPYTAQEVEERLTAAYRIASTKWIEVYLGADEDAQLRPQAGYRDVFAGPLKSVDDLKREWWEHYGSSDSVEQLKELGFEPWYRAYGPGMSEGVWE